MSFHNYEMKIYFKYENEIVTFQNTKRKQGTIKQTKKPNNQLLCTSRFTVKGHFRGKKFMPEGKLRIGKKKVVIERINLSQ